MDNFILRPRAFLPPFLVLFMCVASSAQFTIDREPPGPSSRKTGLVITEIMYHPRAIPGLATNLTLEFIEVFNSKPWDENISGFSIDGSVRYVFPSNTILPAGAYIVVARVPDLIQSNYGITNVHGPWDGASTNGLSTEAGVVRLRNSIGAVLLEVNYRDSPPWPEAADGAGHSLALLRPSWGEDNYQAWAESDRIGGSPGSAEPFTQEPLASVLINELQNHSDPADWIELYNRSNEPVDLSGAYLSDDPFTNKFRIPDGTVIPARGYLSWDQNQLGFELFAGGETIYFWNSNAIRVIDVVDFRGSSNNISFGRAPDGGPNLYVLQNTTRNVANSVPMRFAIGINEIMFNPISGNTDDEFVEIHNRSGSAVNISGWELPVGISYVFPTNSLTLSMPAGAYWVIARNPTNLAAIYSNLSTNVNLFGPFGGTLANGGERLLLTGADYDIVLRNGVSVIEKLQIPLSDVSYGDGGKWGQWSDGLGSSLELIDPEAEVTHPSNWADSNDTGESQWTAIEYNGPLGETLGSPSNDSVIIMLQGVGECLVDEVEVRVDNGPNLVANGGFEADLSGWLLQGSHDFSTIENTGFAGSRSLHVRAASRGDNQSNRILSQPFANSISSSARQVSIRAKVKWLRGHPELLVRLHGSATEAYGRLALPRRLGTPGTSNSTRIANAGPAIYDVRHEPVLPAAGQPIVVTARVADRHGVAAIAVRYRIDPNATYTDVPMLDDGTGGDEIMGDGLYSATIPGQPDGEMVAFYLDARDSSNGIGTFPQDVFPKAGLTRCWPTDALARECVVRWGEPQMAGDFATYHLWVTQVNSNRWHTRDPMNNTSMDGTFVYNDKRVIYNALPLFSGSPFHRTNSTAGPAGPLRVDYEMNFPDDEPLLGATDFVLNNPGNPDRLTISDLSAVNEAVVYRIFEGMGLPNNHRRYIHFFVNGNQRSTAYERAGNFIFEDSQQPNGDVIAEWFPNDAGGHLFKVEDWFEFNPNGIDPVAYNDADMTRRTVRLNGEETFVPAPYRFMFRKRSVGVGNSANDYSQLFALIDATSPADNPTNAVVDPARFGAVADFEAWMRHFAVQRAVGNFDSFGWARGKNDYLYRGASGFSHLPWDVDYALGLGRPPHEPLFEANDPRIAAMFNTPEIVRAYWRAFDDLIKGPFNNLHLDPFIDARVAALLTNHIDIDLDAVADIKAYVGERRAYLEDQLATVAAPFGVAELTSYETTNSLLVITGTAPVSVKQILVNGLAYPIHWITPTSFVFRVVLAPGANDFTFTGQDRFGAAIAGASHLVTIDYNGPVADPVGAFVFSEIMFNPIVAGAQFIELLNRSPFTFDLTGWRMDGANFTFPLGSIITNGQRIVLTQDRDAFRRAYGNVSVLGTFVSNLSTQGQSITLVKPESEIIGDTVIAAFRYETALPWPPTAPGASLQLIDSAQDTSRPSNWAFDLTARSTPGMSNSVATALPAYDPLWLNEVQTESLNGPLDNFSEFEPWIEIYNSGAQVLSLDAYFLANNYSTNLAQWPFPAGAAIAPGEHLLVWADGETNESTAVDWHTSFRLESSGTLALVRLTNGAPQITDYLTWNRLGANVSHGAAPDGQLFDRFHLHAPSPRGTNNEPPLRLFINEWMTRNLTNSFRDPADTDTDDWIEIHNAEAFTVDLSGMYLTDNPANPTKYRVPTNGQYRIGPGGFFIVWADDEAGQNNGTRSDLHTNFKLDNAAGFIGLYAPNGASIDSVTYGAQLNDATEGRYSDGASARYLMPRPTPRLPNGVPNYNSPPSFPIVTNRFVAPGQTIIFSVRATDPDGNVLAYQLVTGPTGSMVPPGGAYRWVVPTNQPPGEYPVVLSVTDDGVPPRSNTVAFTVTVVGPSTSISGEVGPRIYALASVEGQTTFTFETIPGRTYRVLYKDDLEAPVWTQLDREFVAANTTASLSDLMAVPRRFYWVFRVD